MILALSGKKCALMQGLHASNWHVLIAVPGKSEEKGKQVPKDTEEGALPAVRPQCKVV